MRCPSLVKSGAICLCGGTLVVDAIFLDSLRYSAQVVLICSETFTSRGEFLAKSQTYQLYFNLARPNSHKENQTPWQIIERLAPRSPLQLCLLPPVFLDYYLNDSGGYDVPSYPYLESGSMAGGPTIRGLILETVSGGTPGDVPISAKPLAWFDLSSMNPPVKR
jgi:hypothetical protein